MNNINECEYCHSDEAYSGPYGRTPIDVPQDYLGSFNDEVFIDLYVLHSKLCLYIKGKKQPYQESIKINYCPICGRKLNGGTKHAR